jgi:hypothetical protein
VTEPTHLTRDQLAPIVAAVYRREAATLTGARLILPPLPPCPTCGQQPTELTTSSDSHDLFVRNLTALRFRPCGHTFTADGEDIYEAYNTARQEPESPLPDEDTSPEAPPAATPLEDAQATIESLRYQIRRAREALATDEPVDRCPSCEHRWDIHADDGCWHTVTHGRADRNLVCACRIPRKEQP